MEFSKEQQEKLALLDDTVKYYSEDTRRRCIGHGQCFYSPEKAGNKLSTGCAVGRLLDIYTQLKLDLCKPSAVPDIFELLPENVKKYGVDFLDDLQRLHDNEANWNDDGITMLGESVVAKIIEKIKLNIL